MTADLEDDRIHAQLRAWADDLAERVPPHRAARPLRRGRPSVRAGMLAAALVAIAVLAVTQYVDGGGGLSVASGGGVKAKYERHTYSQEEDLICATAPLGGDEGTAVIETWGDREGERWRTRVTYGSGATRDVLVEGSPWYPTAGWERGELGLGSLGCTDAGGGVVVAEPAQGVVLALNPMAPIPSRPNSGGAPAVPGHEALGQVVAGDHTDSEGRPAVLWQQVVTGFVGARPVVQTTSWYVNRITGEVLEKTFVSKLEGVGTAQWRLTSEVLEYRTVPPNTFDSAGMRAIDLMTSDRGRSVQ